jgi:hypothetical protein
LRHGGALEAGRLLGGKVALLRSRAHTQRSSVQPTPSPSPPEQPQPSSSRAARCARRYQLRKINADKRPRIKGRFVKKEELDDYVKGRPAALPPAHCPELAAFRALAALELPALGPALGHEEGEGLLDPAMMFDGGSSEYDHDHEGLEELGL